MVTKTAFFLAALGICIAGIIGMGVFTLVGGNYAVDFTAFGLRGYEATGIIGLYVGLIIGTVLAALLLYKRYFRSSENALFFVLGTIIVLLIILAPLRGNNSSLLRTCRFDESSGRYSKCLWSWDDRLDAPSVYF
jgi:hypothetical protein